MEILLALLGVLVAAVLAVVLFMYILIPTLKGIGWLIGGFFWLIGATIMHIVRFVVGMIRDTLRAIGAIPAGLLFALMSVGNVVIGRWSAASYYGSNMQREIKTFALCIYRVALGHPLYLIGLSPMLEGLERRVPAAMAEAPGRDKPSRRTGAFDGYTIVGSLPGGGSGGKLYIAEPIESKREQLVKANGGCPDRVVIKSFAIADGSSLPQIIRESRALESARKIGLVLEHELDDERFFYIMPYVPGDNLGAVTRQMHAESGERGLSDSQVRLVLGYLSDVLQTLNQYHSGGLWHKDIKPDNIIVHNNRAHVVDLGLVTPLRSAMTLTTHGTEYFRDPEMVRMALRGVKVHEVDGVKFDLFAAGAVLYHIIENTFPSHGGLSATTKQCPDAVKWIIRRAMTDYQNRYDSAVMMLGDIEAVRTAPNMSRIKPAQLPSMVGASPQSIAETARSLGGQVPGPAAFASARAGSPVPPRPGQAGPFGPGQAGPSRQPRRSKPRIRIVNWWTGSFRRSEEQQEEPALRWRQDPSENPGKPVGPISSAIFRIKDPRVRGKVASVKMKVQKIADDLRNQGEVAAQDVENAVADVAQAVGDEVGPKPSRRPPSRATQARAAVMAGTPRPPAYQQVANARKRAAERRHRAQTHRRNHRGTPNFKAPGERLTGGVFVAGVFVVSVVLAGSLLVWSLQRGARTVAGPPEVPDPGNGYAESFEEPDFGPEHDGISPNNSMSEPLSFPNVTSEQLVPNAVSGSNPSTLTIHIEGKSEAFMRDINDVARVFYDPAYSIPSSYLLINEHPAAMDAAVSSEVEQRTDLLQLIGLEPFENETDLESRVRLLISEHAPDIVDPSGAPSESARTAVMDLLSDEPEIDLGLVVWVYADQSIESGSKLRLGGDSSGSSDTVYENIRYWVAMPENAPESIVPRVERMLLED